MNSYEQRPALDQGLDELGKSRAWIKAQENTRGKPMFATLKNSRQVNKLINMLRALACVTKMNGGRGDIPFMYYRGVEEAYCVATGAKNLGKDDIVVDAVGNGVGVAIKTFLEGQGSSYQIIGEFGAGKPSYDKLEPLAKIKKVCGLRNRRIEDAKRLHGLNEVFYLVFVRGKGKIMMMEQPLRDISLRDIRIKKVTAGTIHFSDGQHEYKFDISDSKLYKKFYSRHAQLTFTVKILKNPYKALFKLIGNSVPKITKKNTHANKTKKSESVVLPLFSTGATGKYVPARSGINQWNAKGRKRSADEAYVSVPSWLYDKFPDFLPKNGSEVSIVMSDARSMRCKACQQGGKALMSIPNRALGTFILRDELNIKPGKMATYEDLLKAGIDGIRLSKISNKTFSLEVAKVGEYEKFHKKHNPQAKRAKTS